MLIDDNPRYAVECASAGIDVLLYDWNDSYPWSKTADGWGLSTGPSSCFGVTGCAGSPCQHHPSSHCWIFETPHALSKAAAECSQDNS